MAQKTTNQHFDTFVLFIHTKRQKLTIDKCVQIVYSDTRKADHETPKTPKKMEVKAMKENNPRRKWYIYRLVNKDGVELARGQLKDVMAVEYPRFVYGHIYTDTLFRTNERLYK